MPPRVMRRNTTAGGLGQRPAPARPTAPAAPQSGWPKDGAGNPTVPGGGGGTAPVPTGGGGPMPGITPGTGQTWTPNSGQSVGDWMNSQIPGGGGGMPLGMTAGGGGSGAAPQLDTGANLNFGPSGWPQDRSGNPTVPKFGPGFDGYDPTTGGPGFVTGTYYGDLGGGGGGDWGVSNYQGPTSGIGGGGGVGTSLPSYQEPGSYGGARPSGSTWINPQNPGGTTGPPPGGGGEVPFTPPPPPPTTPPPPPPNIAPQAPPPPPAGGMGGTAPTPAAPARRVMRANTSAGGLGPRPTTPAPPRRTTPSTGLSGLY